jgi:hypothetical protein
MAKTTTKKAFSHILLLEKKKMKTMGPSFLRIPCFQSMTCEPILTNGSKEKVCWELLEKKFLP